MRRAALVLTLSVVIASALSGGAADAQEEEFVALQVPRGEASEAYREAAGRRVQHGIRYSDGSPEATLKPEREPVVLSTPELPELSGVSGLLIVLALLMAGIFLFLRYGAAGNLFARAPEQSHSRKPPPTVPEAWNIGAATAGDLFARLAAMSDRSAALVLLQRHALMAAAEATDTRFARSDTEREALRRIPSDWPHTTALCRIQHATELAHYGGRPVSEAEFEACLSLGREVLR